MDGKHISPFFIIIIPASISWHIYLHVCHRNFPTFTSFFLWEDLLSCGSPWKEKKVSESTWRRTRQLPGQSTSPSVLQGSWVRDQSSCNWPFSLGVTSAATVPFPLFLPLSSVESLSASHCHHYVVTNLEIASLGLAASISDTIK